MRIDLLITELRTGGAERCLTELAIGLAERGERVRVMSLGVLPDPPRDELVDRLRTRGIEVRSADARGVRSLPRALRTVQQWLAEDPPEVLQTFLYHANVMGTLAARRSGVGVVVGGVRVADPHWGRILVEGCMARRMAGVICVSRAVESFVRRRWNPPRDVLLTTIRNGIRPERFAAAEPYRWDSLGVASGGRVLLFIGRLHRQKGVDQLMDVAPSFLNMHPDLRLVIVGDGPLEGMVRRVIARLPEGRGAWLPWQKDVPRLYAGADIVLVPSRYEGMPNVVLETMASGKAVVASADEGVAEILGPLADGQIFPPGDRGSMVQRIDALVRRDDLAALGEANRRRAVTEFSIDAMVESYRRVYGELVRRPVG